MINLKIELEGEDKLQSWLLREPVELLRAVQQTVSEGTDIMGMMVRPLVPVLTGRLAASQFQTLRETPFGAVGVVAFADVKGTYPEHGTREHGRAQHYALHAAEVSRPLIDRLFNYKIRSAL